MNSVNNRALGLEVTYYRWSVPVSLSVQPQSQIGVCRRDATFSAALRAASL